MDPDLETRMERSPAAAHCAAVAERQLQRGEEGWLRETDMSGNVAALALIRMRHAILNRTLFFVLVAVLPATATNRASAQETADLAKQAQNPIARTVSHTPETLGQHRHLRGHLDNAALRETTLGTRRSARNELSRTWEGFGLMLTTPAAKRKRSRRMFGK
jgi:hypothetical protein